MQLNGGCNLLLSCGSTDCVTDRVLTPNAMWGVVYYELLQCSQLDILWQDETTIAINLPKLKRDATRWSPETGKEAASRLISGVLPPHSEFTYRHFPSSVVSKEDVHKNPGRESGRRRERKRRERRAPKRSRFYLTDAVYSVESQLNRLRLR